MTVFTKNLAIGACLALIGSQSVLAQTDHQSTTHVKTDHTAHSQAGAQSGENVQIAEALGTILEINNGNRKVSVKHDPINSLGWPAMNMNFAVSTEIDLTSFKAKDRVQFTLRIHNNNEYLITELCGTHKSILVTGLCKTTLSEENAPDHDDAKSHDH